MIRPPSRNGVAFSEATDGDLRGDIAARTRASRALGVTDEWATVRQVHGRGVVRVGAAGDAGAADALWTTASGLPLAVFTADCFGVVLHSDAAVGVAHAGWRGADAGVVAALRDEMGLAGHDPIRAEIGAGIGPCCFEVGPEVVEAFRERFSSSISEDERHLDLWSAAGAAARGAGVGEVFSARICTSCNEDLFFSHRRDKGKTGRQALVARLLS